MHCSTPFYVRSLSIYGFGYFGRVSSYMQIFDRAGVGTLNSCVIQGSAVLIIPGTVLRILLVLIYFVFQNLFCQ